MKVAGAKVHCARNWEKMVEEHGIELSTDLKVFSENLAASLKLQFEQKLGLHVRQMIGKERWNQENNNNKKKQIKV